MRRVANLAEATAAIGDDPSPKLQLWSPLHAAEVQGVLWFVKLQQIIQTTYPDRDIELVLDCGNRGDLAIEAIRQGLKAIALGASAEVMAKVADIAQAEGAHFYEQSGISAV